MVGGVLPLITIPPELAEPIKSELGVGIGVPTRSEQFSSISTAGFSPGHAERENKNIPVNEALDRLEVIAKNVAEVQHHVSKFIDLWKDIKEKLSRMQSQMREGEVAVGDQLGLEVGRDWADVVAQYKAYRDTVSNRMKRLIMSD